MKKTFLKWCILTRKKVVHFNPQNDTFGTKYEIEGPLNCPDGRSPQVRTVWQVDTDELAPRLITAYPVFK